MVYIITSECNESDASIKKAKTKAEIDATKAADERRKETETDAKAEKAARILSEGRVQALIKQFDV